jgi:hypothetical protein
MTREIFYQRKNAMEALLIGYRQNPNLSTKEKESVDSLLKLLNEYDFSNRLEMKGTMSGVMIDSLHIDYAFGEKVHQFDNSIS